MGNRWQTLSQRFWCANLAASVAVMLLRPCAALAQRTPEVINRATLIYFHHPTGQTNEFASEPVRTIVDPLTNASAPVIRFYRDESFSEVTRAISIGSPLCIQLEAPACNRNPLVSETNLVTISSRKTGDQEIVLAVETGPDTGVFRVLPAVPTRSSKTQSILSGNEILETDKNDRITAGLDGCGGVQAEATVMVDPGGVVFDSRKNTPVAGAQVTLIDVSSGLPALVFESDGKRHAPNPVVTGSEGLFIFPLVSPGTYRLEVLPPPNYVAPSKVPLADLPEDRAINYPGSYGGAFRVTLANNPLQVDIPVDSLASSGSGLFVQKIASRTTAEIGDIVEYVVRVKNGTGEPLAQITVQDTLPLGFAYQKRSARLESWSAADPKGSPGPQLEFTITNLANEATATITYRVRIGPGAFRGTGENTALAVSEGPPRRVSNLARAKVELATGVFTDRGYLIGKVFLDLNTNRVQDTGEVGVPGVRMFIEDGTYVITDSEGKYSLYGLRAKTHVIKVDKTTLPRGARLLEMSSRDAGRPSTRFIEMKFFEMHKANFAIAPSSAELMQEIFDRRKQAGSAGAELDLGVRTQLTRDGQPQAVGDPKSLPASGVIGGVKAQQDKSLKQMNPSETNTTSGSPSMGLRTSSSTLQWSLPDHSPRSQSHPAVTQGHSKSDGRFITEFRESSLGMVVGADGRRGIVSQVHPISTNLTGSAGVLVGETPALPVRLTETGRPDHAPVSAPGSQSLDLGKSTVSSPGFSNELAFLAYPMTPRISTRTESRSAEGLEAQPYAQAESIQVFVAQKLVQLDPTPHPIGQGLTNAEIELTMHLIHTGFSWGGSNGLKRQAPRISLQPSFMETDMDSAAKQEMALLKYPLTPAMSQRFRDEAPAAQPRWASSAYTPTNSVEEPAVAQASIPPKAVQANTLQVGAPQPALAGADQSVAPLLEMYGPPLPTAEVLAVLLKQNPLYPSWQEGDRKARIGMASSVIASANPRPVNATSASGLPLAGSAGSSLSSAPRQPKGATTNMDAFTHQQQAPQQVASAVPERQGWQSPFGLVASAREPSAPISESHRSSLELAASRRSRERKAGSTASQPPQGQAVEPMPFVSENLSSNLVHSSSGQGQNGRVDTSSVDAPEPMQVPQRDMSRDPVIQPSRFDFRAPGEPIPLLNPTTLTDPGGSKWLVPELRSGTSPPPREPGRAEPSLGPTGYQGGTSDPPLLLGLDDVRTSSNHAPDEGTIPVPSGKTVVLESKLQIPSANRQTANEVPVKPSGPLVFLGPPLPEQFLTAEQQTTHGSFISVSRLTTFLGPPLPEHLLGAGHQVSHQAIGAGPVSHSESSGFIGPPLPEQMSNDAAVTQTLPSEITHHASSVALDETNLASAKPPPSTNVALPSKDIFGPVLPPNTLNSRNSNLPFQSHGLARVPLEHVLTNLDNSLGFIDLNDGDTLAAPQATIRVKGQLNAKISVSVNGTEVPGSHLGKRGKVTDRKLEAWEFVGVGLRPGTNTLTVTQRDSFGNARGSVSISVVAPDKLGEIKIVLPGQDQAADGKTRAKITVLLEDAHGVPVTARTPITLESSLGQWQVEDLNKKEPGVQVFIEGGQGEFALLAPLEPGDAVITASSGVMGAHARLAFLPELRPMIAVGLIEGRLNLSHLNAGSILPTRSTDGFDEELRNWAISGNDDQTRAAARAAFFLKGKIKGEYLLTAGYDSDKATQERLFRDIQPDEFYPVYGDDSTKGFDAQSTGRLYVRVDKRKCYLLYGDFATQTATEARGLGNYSRALTGVRAHYEKKNIMANVWASQDSMRQVIEEVSANGTSGPYFVGTADGIVNSEVVEILTRDRHQRSVILKSETQIRFTDYEFEPFTGRILFRRPVPSLDPNLNPISIRVTYEVDQGGEKFWTYGADAQAKITQRWEVGGSGARDENPLAPYDLYSANTTYKLGQKTYVLGEVARSDLAGVSGDAARTEIRHQSDSTEARVYYGWAENTFSNSAAVLSGGRIEAGAKVAQKIARNTRVIGQAIDSESLGEDAGSRRGVTASIEHVFTNQMRVEVGGRYSTETSHPASPSTSVPAGITPHEVRSARIKFTTPVPYVRNASLYGEYENDLVETENRMVAVGGEYQYRQKARLYARHELLDSISSPFELNNFQQQNTTVVGLDTEYMKNGQSFNEYRMRDAMTGREAEAATGLRNLWNLSEGVRLNTTFERVSPIIGSEQNEATAGTAAIEYTRNPNWKGTARIELRVAEANDSLLNTFGYARRLGQDYTVLGRTILYVVDDKGPTDSDKIQSRFQAGLAYRQTETDRWSGLFKYEFKVEDGDFFSSTESRRRVNILSLHANFQPHADWLLSGHYANKIVLDTLGGNEWFDAHLFSFRAIYEFTRRWDIALNTATLFNGGFTGAQYAIGPEIGFSIKPNLRIGIGYNFIGFRDRDLGAEDYTQQGVYLALRLKFDEELMGLAKKKEQP